MADRERPHNTTGVIRGGRFVRWSDAQGGLPDTGQPTGQAAAALQDGQGGEAPKVPEPTPLPDRFPSRATLQKAGIGTYEALDEYIASGKSLQEIDGIGESGEVTILDSAKNRPKK